MDILWTVKEQNNMAGVIWDFDISTLLRQLFLYTSSMAGRWIPVMDWTISTALKLISLLGIRIIDLGHDATSQDVLRRTAEEVQWNVD